MIHDFSLIAVGAGSADDPMFDRLYAVCDDCSLWSSQGTVRLTFHREAPTLDQAIGSAIRDLKSIGVSAWLEAVEDPDGHPLPAERLRTA